MKILLSAVALILGLPAAIPVIAAPRRAHVQETPLPAGTAMPQWPRPVAPELPPGAASIHSKDLELVHSPDLFSGFVIRIAGQPMAIGQSRPMIGYIIDGELRWLDLANATNKSFSLRPQRNSIQASLEGDDADGARWQLAQHFSPGSVPGTLDVQTEVTVDHDRVVAFLPMLTVFPGVGTFGTNKHQGLFAGLEYLENEPSSSEADVIGPASKRQVPDSLKLPFPLMVIQHDGRYVALTWQMRPQFSALFDSPDRLFGSGGHVMGVLFPGSNGQNREEGSLLPRVAEVLHARELLTLRATLAGGLGQSVVPAVQQYVALRGLPALPETNFDLQQYVSLAAGGWLNSKIREGNLFRHAIAGGNFNPGPAADAAVMMEWLALQTRQPALAARLTNTAHEALAVVPPGNLNVARVGHVHYPVAALIYGHVAENAARATQTGRALLSSFEADGSVRYRPREGGPDFAKTHFSNEASGLASRAVLDLLEAAAFSGDRGLLDAGLKRLRAMDKFRKGVPRGAQTWECPLHTPDILASAQMVRAYTLGYELTGDTDFLEQARYWAWTGVPFVYLHYPVLQPIGLYSTIAVFGATQWKAPVWMGLPVQWCGLVYADALYRLVRHDPKSPWKKLADGITFSGIQQTWPPDDAAMQGLLPDSFVLRAQKRNGPAINPATVEACAVRYFGQTPLYDFWCFRKNGVRVHAPGAILDANEKPGRVSFQIETWLHRPYFVLLNGLTKQPRLKINGKKTDCSSPHQFQAAEGRLILQLEGKSRVELGL